MKELGSGVGLAVDLSLFVEYLDLYSIDVLRGGKPVPEGMGAGEFGAI
jgi:hypothetical protein